MLNKFAQGLATLGELTEWFNNFDSRGKIKVIEQLGQYLLQTHPTKEFILEKITKIPLKDTMTPIILLRTYDLKIAIDRICKLPIDEYYKSFMSLLILFEESDTYRRINECKGNCTHSWHNKYVSDIEPIGKISF